MLPTTRIGPDLSRTVSKHHISKPTQDVNRKHRPIRAAFAPTVVRVSAKANVAPTRTSLDHGISTPTLEAVDPSVVDVHQQNVAISGSQSRLSHSASATSLAGSESELALLLNGTDLSRPGTTTINIGSIPISVPIAYLKVPVAAEAAEGGEQQQQCATAEEPSTPAALESPEPALLEDAAAAAHSKLNPTSAEFYPSTYLAAAAATALAAQSISSSATESSNYTEADSHEQHTISSADVEQQSQEEAGSDTTPEHIQQPVVEEQQMLAWQQQQWQQWQQPMPLPVPMFFPVPVPIPPYMMPAAYQYAWQQQQWLQQQQHHLHMQQMQMSYPGRPQAESPVASAAVHDSSSSADAMGTPPPSPAASLPADTSSLMSVPSTAAAHNWTLAHSSSLYSSSRPGSSASSVVSFAGNSRSRQQQGRLRDAGTVTVSALSCVKDAAGALAKVVSRHGSCLLLSLARPGDVPAQATHVAAKSLAVARFYVNAHMAAEGRAGVDAAAVLSGAEPAPSTAVEQQSADELVFMPYHRSSSSRAADAEPPLGFMVAKASACDLPVALPPPVGIPACMQDRQSQQQQQQQQSEVAAAAAVEAQQSNAPLLKAGANTDVNKLSNAIIHNILGCNHVALQLAGAAACHVAMKALIKARARLQRKFEADIVATASFANEDTSSSIGRSTVFLRLDVMRSNILRHLMEGGAAAGVAISRSVSEVGEVIAAPQQHQQPVVAAV